jgi:phage tail protein X|nr:MAG TPA: baseplate wedge protein [Caudoviricetes sp.]
MAKTYTTIQGDMWDGIAKRMYGTERAINILLEANQQHNNTVIFSAGVVLTVPDYEPPRVELLPPWRR